MSGLYTPFPDWPFGTSDKVTVTRSSNLGMQGDVAIKSAREDRFERSAYASKVAKLIQNTAVPGESTIYGLTGEWGSGKTSLVNLIIEDLSQLPGSWEVVHYNPWAASDPESLIEEFYRAVVASLPKNEIGDAIKDILQKSFRSIRPISETLGSLGYLEARIASKIVDTASGVNDVINIWKPGRESWPTLYAKASREFERLDKQILLIVDDVDRLHTDELALLMKVVRLLGRFPRVNYLLIYDEESLLATLVESTAVGGNKEDALRFMEKIVQYPIDVPQLTSDQIEKQLTEIIEALPAQAKKSDEQENFTQIQREIFPVWERTLTTPRTLRRYAALLVNWLNIYDLDEVNTGDLMILATLRLVFPSVYAQIPPYKESLLNNRHPSVGLKAAGHKGKEFDWKETLGKGLDDLQIELLETMLSLLFPKLESNSFISTRELRPRAISTEVYFDTYVLFQAPKHVISDQSLESILKDSDANGAIRLAELVNLGGIDRASSVVAKLPEVIGRLQNDSQRIKAANVLIAAAEDIDDKDRRVRMINLYDEFYFQASMALSGVHEIKNINLFDCFFRNTPLNHVVYYMNKIKYHSRAVGDDPWQSQSYEEINQQCAERVREVLTERDVTDRDLGPYSLEVLTQWPEFNNFRSKLLDELKIGKFDAVDLGVLFLTTAYLIGQDPKQEEIASFNGKLFLEYIPAEQLELLQLDLHEEGSVLNVMDLSWRGRREAVKYALKNDQFDFHRERFNK